MEILILISGHRIAITISYLEWNKHNLNIHVYYVSFVDLSAMQSTYWSTKSVDTGEKQHKINSFCSDLKEKNNIKSTHS